MKTINTQTNKYSFKIYIFRKRNTKLEKPHNQINIQEIETLFDKNLLMGKKCIGK